MTKTINYVLNAKDNVLKPLTQEQFETLCSSENVKAKIQAYRAGNTETKKALYAVLWNGRFCQDFYNKYLEACKQDGATPSPATRKNIFLKPTGLLMLDFDKIDDPTDLHHECIKGMATLSMNPTEWLGLSHITASGKGLRLVVKREVGLTIAKEMDKWSKIVGATCDPACKDLARISFFPQKDDILWYNPQLLFRFIDFPMDEETMTGSGKVTHESVTHLSPMDELFDTDGETYDGVPLKVLVKLMEYRLGGAPEEGNRHNFVLHMAANLRWCMGFDPVLMKKYLPTYGLPPCEFNREIEYMCTHVEHEATLMNVLMAGTGAGKNCISEPINRIMADIRMRDAKNLRREREWKREVQTKGANKDKRHRPEGLVIQEIDPDMTNAAFVQRLADADERFLYAKLNEIDQFDALKTSARSKAQFQIMCLAFDPGNVYGQTRVGTGSVSERVCIRFNWNASTTVQKGQRYFQGVLTDGPISRINFCTIPEREIGAPMPIYGTYDEAFDENLRPYIERLNAARGVVTCAKARTLAKKLIEECADFSRLSQSRVYENLSYRANVIAYLKAMVLYVAQGEKWDKTTENFIRWSLQYDLWCKMQYFGESISEHNQSCQIMERKGPQNLLNLLPDTFTREEAQQLRERLNIHTGSLTNMLNNWKQRGYIVQIAEAQTTPPAHRKYEKTEQYKERGV